jgi:hypothetical protein
MIEKFGTRVVIAQEHQVSIYADSCNASKESEMRAHQVVSVQCDLHTDNGMNEHLRPKR